MWIGIDDTDSTQGGCTTHLAAEAIFLLTKDFDLIGYPRLVRLNPTVPWKTRGNAALCFQLGHGNQEKTRIGSLHTQDISFSTQLIADLSCEEQEQAFELLADLLSQKAETKDSHTNPGLIMTTFQPSNTFYKKSVQDISSLEEITDYLYRHHAKTFCLNNGRGLIGATSACAWIPDDFTYEYICYRKAENIGKPREINEDTVKDLDKLYPSTFDNYDHKNNHNRIAPNTPCPILYGIRGEDPHDLLKAAEHIESEPSSGWIIYQSNQATDDQFIRTQIKDISAYHSVITLGKIISDPKTEQGGHVFVSLQDDTGIIECAAYEPTKEFRDTIRALRMGDIVEVYGAVREDPLCINLEKIHVLHLEEIEEKTENPICSSCGKHMKSKGKNQGYHCINCGTKSNDATYKMQQRLILPGFYEVPVCARRHLSKPLKRYTHYHDFLRKK